MIHRPFNVKFSNVSFLSPQTNTSYACLIDLKNTICCVYLFVSAFIMPITHLKSGKALYLY